MGSFPCLFNMYKFPDIQFFFYSTKYKRIRYPYGYEEDFTLVSDVSQCEKVTFELCSGVTDISLLKDCKHITRYGCENIKDILVV